MSASSLVRESSIVRNKPLKKWSNAILNDDEIEILEKRYSNFKTVYSFGECSPGVVTAANNELILTKEEYLELKAAKFVKPIISKSSYLQNDVEINYELIDKLDLLQKKVYLLDLKHETNLPESLEEYLNCVGNKMRNGKKIKDSYKCSRRNPWYGVPLTQVGDVCFFKRYDRFPRLCLNSSKILTTDIAYNLRVDEEYDPKSVVFSFYNSFTLALCEFHCRYYGGGVAELTPKEFAALKIPYRKINKEQWKFFADLMHNGAQVQEIVQYVDPIVLNDWSQKELEQLREIWKKLKHRRSNKRLK